MPRLSDPRITKGRAVTFLLRLYFEEPEFMTELGQLRQDHSELLAELMAKQLEFVGKCRAVMTTEQYQRTVYDLQGLFALQGNNPDLPRDLACQLNEIKHTTTALGQYFRGLEELASRWKLRAAWAGPMLHLYAMHDYLKGLGVSDTIDVPLEQMDLLYPWPPPVPSLEIKVSSWAFVFYGRKEIQARIARKLEAYEDELKAVGMGEYPSSLERHAKWWFEHFVHGKQYDDISEEEGHTPGGSLISYARNVGEAVRRFSRLIGIDIKHLKCSR
jgi:hypothetical protein